MGSNGRRTGPSIEDALFDRGYEFEFFQAARLLARLFPDRKDVGSAAKPAEEFARLAAELMPEVEVCVLPVGGSVDIGMATKSPRSMGER